MKLADSVLLEIVDILRIGISEGKDISEMLRELDLEPSTDEKLELSEEYRVKKGRVV